MIGSSVSQYRITAKLGAGGMGEVYRATDTKLGRDVAIKVLPAALADEPDRLARFEREAKLLASLNHPRIAHVYGFESATLDDRGVVHFLAMELVEGEDLAQRLARGAIPVDEALEIARQIAEALEEAHEHGIVHRDLKPGNVKVTPDGKVKVLDFGLAKAYAGESAPGSSTDLTQSPTLAATGTQAGVILGTAAYMSPEQARGRPVDRRADVWAFGVVLYEMLTGRSLFSGETVSDVLAAVLRAEIDLASLPAATPAAIRLLVRRCLERDPRNRLHDAGDARIAIDEVISGRPEPVIPHAVAPRASRLPWFVAAIAVAVAAIAVVAALLARPALRGGGGAPQVVHVEFVPPRGERLDPNTQFGKRRLAISPDGSRLVYVIEKGATTELRVRALDSGTTAAIPGTEGAQAPFFSPDGKWVGFTAAAKLRKVALAGGAPIVLADAPDMRGAAWGEDGWIYFEPNLFMPVSRVRAEGGAVQAVTRIRADEGELHHRWPELVPGGRVLLYAIGYGEDWDKATIVAERLDSGERTVLVRGGTWPRYLPTGHLVYARAKGLYALGLDVRSLAVTGPPVEVARNVQSTLLGVADADFSKTGILVSAPADASGGTYVLSWLDRQGRGEPLKLGPGDYNWISLSPSGDRAAIAVGNGISILDLVRGALRPLTLARRAELPMWSQDGRRVYFSYEEEKGYHVTSKAADDSGQPEVAFLAEGSEDPYAFARDGTRLLTIWFPRDGANELRIRGLSGSRDEPTTLLKSRSLDWENAGFSPDDRWVVYQSRESGRPEIYVMPMSGRERKWQVSVDGGRAPVWSRTGDEIFFLCGERFLAAPVQARGDDLEVGTPRVLFDNHRVVVFAAARDGKRFLVAEDPDPGAQSRLDVVVNWFAEVERKVAEARTP